MGSEDLLTMDLEQVYLEGLWKGPYDYATSLTQLEWAGIWISAMQ